jgi:hypothetical protein
MTAGEVMLRLKAVFDRAGIHYMVTGSFASSHHGEPRSTQDIDLVVEATKRPVSRIAVAEAAHAEGQFNIIDLTSGWKIDMILRKSTP